MNRPARAWYWVRAMSKAWQKRRMGCRSSNMLTGCGSTKSRHWPQRFNSADGLAVDRLQLLPARFQLGLDLLQLRVPSGRTAAGRFGNGGRLPLGVLHFLLGLDLLVLESLGDVLPGLFILPQRRGMFALEALDRLLRNAASSALAAAFSS